MEQVATIIEDVPIITEDAPTKSKNQIKREVRLAKRVGLRKDIRKKEKERRKEKGIVNLAVKTNITTGETTKFHRKCLKNNLMADSKCKLKIAIDCSFEQMMSDSDVSHLAKQLSYSYAKNRRLESPLQFYVTSCDQKTDSILEKSGLSNWDIHLHKQHYLQVFKETERKQICYLTSESPNELDTFDEDTVYVIGGLVDHNHYKSHCFDLAVKEGLSHAQLPIGKFMHMKTRQVLTVNQVFEIVCNYSECGDWQKSFVSVLPKRKGAETLKVQGNVQEVQEKEKLEENMQEVQEKEKVEENMQEVQEKEKEQENVQKVQEKENEQENVQKVQEKEKVEGNVQEVQEKEIIE